MIKTYCELLHKIKEALKDAEKELGSEYTLCFHGFYGPPKISLYTYPFIDVSRNKMIHKDGWDLEYFTDQVPEEIAIKAAEILESRFKEKE